MDHDDEIQEFLKETGLESLVPEDGGKKGIQYGYYGWSGGRNDKRDSA